MHCRVLLKRCLYLGTELLLRARALVTQGKTDSLRPLSQKSWSILPASYSFRENKRESFSCSEIAVCVSLESLVAAAEVFVAEAVFKVSTEEKEEKLGQWL